MKHRIAVTAACLLALSTFVLAEEKGAPAPQKIEVCFVLDTTGSMSGLIEGAKGKIWTIANQIVKSKPTPQLKIALVGYRDRADEYVTKRFDLTDDIDAVYKNLQGFSANGGGDGPESVNQAIAEAIDKVAWTNDKSVLKVIFLVGDAPPHMDYDNDERYPALCKRAVKKDLIINTVQCGTDGTTTPVWQEIARSAEGSFVQLGQTGDMVAVSTPMDAELAELNKQVGKTLVAYGVAGRGTSEVRRELETKQSLSEAAPASVAADRLYFNYNSAKTVQGEGELIDGIEAGVVKLDDLKDEQLPEDLRNLSKEDRSKRISELQTERAKLRTRIAELSKKREEYIAAERKKAVESNKVDAFDDKVATIINEQAARKR